MQPTLKLSIIAANLLLTACSGGSSNLGSNTPATPALPQLAAATGATLASCTDLATKIQLANTTITAANAIAAGALTIAGKPVPAHCQVTGRMFDRVSTVDGQRYAIGFEMRLPTNWNGRFFYQANGGLDGSVVPATGPVGGGGPLDNALNQGFAVISSDAGHGAPTPFFGADPQARLDYGYQAVGKLTPMAKSLIETAYGKKPDRSYIGGCSNGGRHAMVAAARYADQYDGVLVGNPGYRLPLAAVANIAGGKAYASLATTAGDPSTGFTAAERTLVSNAVLAKCDALDGATDGMVQNTQACQAAFDLNRDVATCTGARDGSCLSVAQKTTIGGLFAGATTAAGTRIYTSFPYDAGLATSDWASWKFSSPTTRDSGAVGLVFQAPPENGATFDGAAFVRDGDLAAMLTKVGATSGLFTESALSFMVPPNATDLSQLKNRGAKMMVYHGTSDPIFSSNDSAAWYDGLRTANGGDASNFARYYQVPGMNHCSGGPSAEQFDMLTPLVNWVEKGVAPDSVTASARGAGNAGGVNASVPAAWSPARSRPLCPYPKAAKYKGSGSIEDAANFSCS
ncbi:tannase/feruloyl esterase family alpha/beta hydrolase [Duganella sp. Leaf61]|uniref:tannase/feruloyl esterase family alpha/beta hydrolase n=1 Tax=Duganella sp. Leaf61 TaxID=1736227 RepID=UPI000ADFC986|nr:tannase/feruloyl esterase family alpha/beta hydrolase [Duganella sp. Leaf61]